MKPQPASYLQAPAQLMLPSEKLQELKAGATLNDALQTVTDNYGACQRTANKLDGLQMWVKGQSDVETQVQ